MENISKCSTIIIICTQSKFPHKPKVSSLTNPKNYYYLLLLLHYYYISIIIVITIIIYR